MECDLQVTDPLENSSLQAATAQRIHPHESAWFKVELFR